MTKCVHSFGAGLKGEERQLEREVKTAGGPSGLVWAWGRGDILERCRRERREAVQDVAALCVKHAAWNSGQRSMHTYAGMQS